MKGKAHVFKRDHINTDEIIPARYLNTDDEAILARHVMEDLDVSFITRVKPGDFIVAGCDFGCGSSREHAVWSLRGAGVKGVIAESFARIFFRNGVNNGFLLVEYPGITSKISDGDELDVDLRGGIIRNLTTGEEISFIALPDFALRIMEAGGLLEYMKENAVR